MTLKRLSVAVGLWLVLVSLGFGACGGGSESSPDPTEVSPLLGAPAGFQVFIVSTDLAVGQQRFAFVALDDNTPITNEPIYLRIFKVADSGEATLVGGGPIPWEPTGVDSIDGDHEDGDDHPLGPDTQIRGLYFANLPFAEPGAWGAGFTRGDAPDPEREVRVAFEVRPETQTVGIGQPAIPFANPTLEDAPLSQIDTSPEPDPEFHRLSIESALRSGRPTLIAFATPAFCESRTCGPTMEVVGAAYDEFGEDVDFVHVEPFQLQADGKLKLDDNGARLNASAGNAWQLPSEPWVFITNADGIVVARFEGLFALIELRLVLEGLTGG